MKIAVLTMTFNNNYGGYLQSYALMETLKKLGHKPELLFVQLENNNLKSKLKKFTKKYILTYITNRWKIERFKYITEKHTNYFSDKYIIPKSQKIFNVNDFHKITQNKYDAYIVGSDQVWRPTMNKFIDQAFFAFIKNSKAILLSYAPSFGIDQWEYTDEQSKIFGEQIKKFKAVSVREDSGVELCKKYLKVQAKHVLDPTMLLDIEDYRKIIKLEDEPSFKGGLLSYILDKTEDKQSLEDMIANECNLKPYSVNIKSKEYNASVSDRTYPTVTSWIKGFDDAKYVVTDSFHGCVFAIIFNKPFIVYGNEQRGMARFNSLLKMFDLENRLVFDKNDITKEKINENIDWIEINIKLNKYKKISKDFLIDNLQ